MKKFLLLLIGFLFICGSVAMFFIEKPRVEKGQGKVFVGEISINVEVANSPLARAQGLSGKPFLNDGEGMLFIFEESQIPAFWMKEMNFPIDIVWIDEEFRVVGVEKGVSPETFPKTFRPNRPITYVLEVPSGFSEKNGIDTGTVLFFDL